VRIIAVDNAAEGEYPSRVDLAFLNVRRAYALNAISAAPEPSQLQLVLSKLESGEEYHVDFE
jgi:hypothetical protein